MEFFPANNNNNGAVPVLKNSESELSIQPVQNEPLSELQLLFNQAMNPDISFKERAHSSFDSLLDRCTKGSKDAEQMLHFQTIAGETLLTHAITHWNNDWVERLKAYPNLCLQKDAQGNTPLHVAAKSGSIDSFFSLLNVLGLQTTNKSGQSAVHTAIAHGQVDIIRGLLERRLLKSDTVMINVDGFSLNLLTYALVEKQWDIYALLLQSGLFEKDQWLAGLGNPLHVAAYYGSIQACEYLIENASHLFNQWGDQENEAGQTPLHLAATRGSTELVIKFYERFPRSLETADKKGHRPIYAAAFALKPACVELLVALGCKAEYFNVALEQLRSEPKPETQTMVNFMENLQPLLDDPHRRKQYGNVPITYVALRGGGAKGPGEIGALDTLAKLGYTFKGYSGTSIGAILATLSAVGYTPKELEKKFIEKSFVDLFDHPLKDKKLSDLLPSSSYLTSLFSVYTNLKSFIANPVGYGLNKAKGLINSLIHVQGLCSGEALRVWVEELICEKTGIRYLTYGELAEKKKGNLPHLPVSNLFVSITSIKGESQQLLCMNTIDPEWKHHIVSDGARSSASYPGALVPHAEYIKVKGENDDEAQRVKIEGSMHLDGGILSNGATLPLDEVRFIKPVDGPEGRRPEFNRGVIALSFLSAGQGSKSQAKNFTVFDLMMGIIDVYMGAEDILNANPYYETRAIKIPVKVGTISFPSEDEKREMIESGRRATKEFMDKREHEQSTVRNFVSLVSRSYREFEGAKYSFSPTHPRFSGRRSHLEQIKNALVSDLDNWKPRQPCKEVLLHGPEGMGKSLIATAFANQHQNDFKLIWVIDCHNPELRADSYWCLARALNIPLEKDESTAIITHKVNRALEGLKHPWLLIYDDVQELPQRPEWGGAILLTSRTNLESPFLKDTIRVISFELSDIEELISKNFKIPNPKQLALLVESKFKSHPQRIEQAVRRMAQSSLSPEEYLENLSDDSVTLDLTLLDLKEQAPAHYQFLEELAYLKRVPEAFFNNWAQNRFPDTSPIQIRQYLVDRSRIYYNEKTRVISIPGSTADQIWKLHGQSKLSEIRFNAAIQALQQWAIQNPFNRGEACLNIFNFAQTEQAELWNQCPPEVKASLFHMAGKWTCFRGDAPEAAVGLLKQADELTSDEATKLEIALEIRLCEAYALHHRLPMLLDFAIYLEHLPRSFFGYWLNMSQAEADVIFSQLVEYGVLRDNKKFIELRSAPRDLLLQAVGNFQQSHLDRALTALSEWISHSSFVLKNDGEGCTASINKLLGNAELAKFWNQVPAKFRVEPCVHSAEWLAWYGEAPQESLQMYKTALAICPEGPRKNVIQFLHNALENKHHEVTSQSAPALLHGENKK